MADIRWIAEHAIVILCLAVLAVFCWAAIYAELPLLKQSFKKRTDNQSSRPCGPRP